MKPQTGLFLVDPLNLGGSTARARHAFGMAPVAPSRQEQKEYPAPPPKRVLAEGRPTSPNLSTSEVSAIQKNLGTLAEALKLELETVKAEADTVSGKDLGADGHKIIPVVGTIFNVPEIRYQVILDSKAVGGAAERALSGSASPYLTDSQRATLETVVSDAQALAGYMGQFETSVPEGRLTAFADDHMRTHIGDASALMAAIERNIVSGEASSVPVNEPTSIPVGGLIAIAALIIVGIVIAEIA